MLALSIPVCAQQVITVGVNMMDTIMLGQLDEIALSASAMGAQIHDLFHFMSMGMGMGASVLIARYWGMNEMKSLKKALTIMYRFCFLEVFLFTMLVGLFSEQVLRLLTSDQQVIQSGIAYLRWTLPCFFLYGMSMITTIVLRNIGKVRIPLYTAIGAFFVNVFFNWMFIFGKLGAPAMGVAGAGLGTLISRIFEFAVICGYFFLKDEKIRFRVKNILDPCKELLGEYLKISIPVMISDTLVGVGNSAVISVAGHVGTSFMSANTITNVIQKVTTIFSAGLGQAALIITGNALGEGDKKKATEHGVSITAVGFVFSIASAILIYLISPAFVGQYKIAAETHAIAMQLMYAVSLIAVFMTPASILTKGVVRGGGDTRFLMFADVFFLWFVSVPLGAAAGLLWHWPPFWIMFCLRIDHVLKCLVCMWRMSTGKWIKKIKVA